MVIVKHVLLCNERDLATVAVFLTVFFLLTSQLFLFLQDFSQKMLSKTHEIEKQLDSLIRDTKATDSCLHSVFNDFLMLSNTQFIENVMNINSTFMWLYLFPITVAFQFTCLCTLELKILFTLCPVTESV